MLLVELELNGERQLQTVSGSLTACGSKNPTIQQRSSHCTLKAIDNALKTNDEEKE